MRRKDREVTRHGDLMEMVARFKVCRLGLWDGREVYVVPLNFGYEEKDGRMYFYRKKWFPEPVFPLRQGREEAGYPAKPSGGFF